MHPAWDYQQALYSALTNDATLMGVVTGVFTSVPESTDYPYIVIASSEGQSVSTSDGQGVALTVRLECFYARHSNEHTFTVVERIQAMLPSSLGSHAIIHQRLAQFDYEHREDFIRQMIVIEALLEEA